MKPLLILALSVAAALLSRGQAATTVRVTEGGKPIPCRITVVDAKGELAATGAVPAPGLAIRTGVVYTIDGRADLHLAPGKYTIYATRGFEYSLAKREIEVSSSAQAVDLKLTREVDTRGYVACDTHIHTREFSGHGDATAAERAVTLAGEGIELPITTEHNQHADWRPAIKAAGAKGWFTPVMGNEVTTEFGHFNVFPVAQDARVPDWKTGDWKKLLADIRATPGVQFVILNHPYNNHSGYRPADHVNLASGEAVDGRDWDVDGMEIVNSSALQSDWMAPIRLWFALLNRGRKITGVGSSDCHDVNLYIVGQGRTYVQCDDTSTASIDVQAACKSLRAGHAAVSHGLLTQMWVDGRWQPGDVATPSGGQMAVHVRVQGPRWINADRVELYQNGELIASRPIPPSDAVAKADVTFTLPKPRSDAWLVAVASGPGVKAPYWPFSRPYQPTRPDWEPRALGVTNPIRIDADGGRNWSSPADIASRLVTEHGADISLLKPLAMYDQAVAVQTASLLHARGIDLAAGKWRSEIDNAAPHIRQAFLACLASIPR